jgi:EmrB/QacA subfamily drug resistance transporter
VTPDAGARPGGLSPADGSGPRELLRYRSAQGRRVVAAMILGSSVAGIDSTVVAVALPAIGRNLHAGFQGLQWTVTSYTLTLASLILLAGSLSDRWGRRRVFLAGLGWFTLASVLCAAAPGIGWLIAARAVQGIGGALLTPASLAIIEAALQPGDRTRAIGTWAGFSGVSAAIAPFLGGWLLQAGSWRAIFLINVPVAAAAAWTTRRHVPESRDTSLSGSADWPGALAGVAALASTTYAILVLPGGGVRSPGFAAAAVLALLSSAAFAVTERRGSHPMLPPAIFAPAQFRAANALTFAVNGALGGFAFVFIPALEITAGDSPVVAGSALVPVTVVTLLLSGASGRLAQRIGPRPPLVAGCLLCAVASMLAVRIGPHAGYWAAVLPVAVLFGLGLASLMPPLTASAMNSAPDSLAGLASGVNNAVARVAGLLWIAALPPITGLTGAAYADPVQFRSSFAQISWIRAAAFACAAVLAATFTGPRHPTPAPRTALIQTPVPHLACPVASAARLRTPQAKPVARARCVDPAVWRFITVAGVPELLLERRLKGIAGIDVKMWPVKDTFDALVTALDGHTWTVDVKDHADPGRIADDPPAAEHVVVPGYRKGQVSQLSRVWILRAGTTRTFNAPTGIGKNVAAELLASWCAQHGKVTTLLVPSNAAVIEASQRALGIDADVVPLMSPDAAQKEAEAAATRGPGQRWPDLLARPAGGST